MHILQLVDALPSMRIKPTHWDVATRRITIKGGKDLEMVERDLKTYIHKQGLKNFEIRTIRRFGGKYNTPSETYVELQFDEDSGLEPIPRYSWT